MTKAQLKKREKELEFKNLIKR